jgi:hypothetical protein
MTPKLLVISVTAIVFTALCQLTSAQAEFKNLQDLNWGLVANPSCTFRAVEAVAGSNRKAAVCAVVGVNGHLFVNIFDGNSFVFDVSSWSGFTDKGGVIIGKPSCTHFGGLNDHVLCGTVGTDSNVFIDVFNGTSWSGFQPIGNIISISDPVCTGIAGTEKAICAIIGTNSSLFFNTFDGTNWSGWGDLNLLVGTTARHTFNPTCTDDLNGGALCGAVTTAGELRVKRFNGTSWDPSPTVLTIQLPQVLGRPNQPVNILMTSDPSCTVVNGTGQLICGVRGAGSGLYVWQFDGTAFSNFQFLGGILATAPSCTAVDVEQNNPRAVCAVRGTDSGLYVNQFNNGIWTGFQPIQGVEINGAPSCTVMPTIPQVLCGVKSTNDRLYVTMGP